MPRGSSLHRKKTLMFEVELGNSMVAARQHVGLAGLALCTPGGARLPRSTEDGSLQTLTSKMDRAVRHMAADQHTQHGCVGYVLSRCP